MRPTIVASKLSLRAIAALIVPCVIPASRVGTKFTGSSAENLRSRRARISRRELVLIFQQLVPSPNRSAAHARARFANANSLRTGPIGVQEIQEIGRVPAPRAAATLFRASSFFPRFLGPGVDDTITADDGDGTLFLQTG